MRRVSRLKIAAELNMATNLTTLFSSRDLVWAWAGRTIRGRYQQSFLGWLWAVIQPAASAAVFTVIFTRFVPIDTGETPYPVFSYVAMVPWAFTASAISDMAVSMVQNMSLVTQIFFPRESLPIAAMVARLLDFGVAAVLVVVLIVVFRVEVFLPGWLFLPVIFLVQIALVLGLGLVAAALNVFFRDVQPLLTLGIQLWFYASPIIYPVTLVDEDLRLFYYLNPMVGVLEAYRSVLLYGRFPDASLLVSAAMSFLVLVGGYWFFKRIDPLFADII
jgi:lipopolysaccharide transport system permease protein